MQKILFDTINSTNTWSLENIDELKDRTLVVANHQSAGKGRFERKWVSDNKDNLYLSIVLKPEKLTHCANLTQYLSVVLTRVLRKYEIVSSIKWPNDVQAEGKKIAGILCESSIKGKVTKGLVLGIGVNLNMSEYELKMIDIPATSLNKLTDEPVNRDTFLSYLTEEFFDEYDEFLEKGFSIIRDEYIKKIRFLGQKITVTNFDKKEEYTAQDIAQDGSLIVLDAQNNEKIILAGDVSFNL